MWFEKIKKYYASGMWSAEMVKNAVVKEKISEEEYEQITGTAYQGDTTDPDLETRVSALEEEMEFTKIIMGVD